ncbi:MAG: hypothetical protein HY064_11900 [Bacteroidetes bacterium]|nr:hypothetical protein [Bacteroidota bacterium]
MKNIFSFRLLLLVAVLLLPGKNIFSQNPVAKDTTKKVIQFSGLIVDGDSLNPLPFVALVVRHTERGVFGNANGYYSMVVQEGDTVDFFGLGYRQGTFIVPDTFELSNNYNHVQALYLDTILLREAIVYPWPSKERFRTAFLSASVPSDDLERARSNLAQADKISSTMYLAADAGMAAASATQMRTQKNYYAGGLPPNNLLNPIAWSRFIQALHNGDLKRQ